MMKTYRLQTPKDMAEIVSAMVEVVAEHRDEPGWRVTIAKHKPKRNEAQNALLWHWHTQVSDLTGYTPAEVHGQAKFLKLMPLVSKWFHETQTPSKTLQKMLDDYGFVRDLSERIDDDAILYSIADRYLRTSTLNGKQFGEYLDAYHAHYAGIAGVPLTDNDDRYYEAMGWRK